MRWHSSQILISAVFFILVGCVSANQPTAPLPPTGETNTPLSTEVQHTSAPTLTFQKVPTLPADDAYAQIGDLLRNRGDCRMPCWLGITPGVSSVLDVQAQLAEFSSIASDSYLEYPANGWLVSEMIITYAEEDMIVEIRSNYMARQGVNTVYVDEFHTRAYRLKDGQYDGDVFGYMPYNALLEPYSISTVLSDYGPPEQVYILGSLRSDTLPVTPGFGDDFEIHLWYPDRGVFMEYEISVEGSGDNYRFCPSNALISGRLTPANLGAGYQEVLVSLSDKFRYFFSPSIYVKTPEDALGMTIEEFYQLFRSPTDRCLETPKSIWWPQ